VLVASKVQEKRLEGGAGRQRVGMKGREGEKERNEA